MRSVKCLFSSRDDLLSSARWRPMLLNTARMRIVARRTPHLNKASGLDATKWWKNDCSLLRSSETTSGGMCSLFSRRKSCRSKVIDTPWQTFILAAIRDKKKPSRSAFPDHNFHCYLGGGSSINHSPFTEVFKDFPTAGYLTRSLHSLNTSQLQGAMMRRKYDCLLETKTFASLDLHSTWMWYLTLPAKCWMTNVPSAFEEVTRNGSSWCSCFNLSNRVSAVAQGSLKIGKEKWLNHY